MNSRRQPVARPTLVLAAACMIVSGCHKKNRVPALPAPPPPPILATITIPPPTHHTEEMPRQETPPPAAPEAPIVQKPRPRRPKKPAAQKPPETATAIAPALPGAPTATADPSPIGELTTGGEAGTQGRQETESLLSSVKKRLDRLSDDTKKTHREQVDRVRLFVKRAQEAWKTGDLEGTRTLATKANVLLDDISK